MSSSGLPSSTSSAKDKGNRSRQLSPTLWFVVRFLLYLAGGGMLYAWLSSSYHGGLTWMMRATATVAGAVLSLFSSEVSYFDQICSFRGFDVRIIDECTGVMEMVIYAAAVIAYPTSWKKRLLGLAGGVPAIYLFNLVRIIFLVIVGAYSRATFDFMHLYFWQVTLIIIIASIWLGWLLLVVHREKS